jgi:hypothetical protein
MANYGRPTGFSHQVTCTTPYQGTEATITSAVPYPHHIQACMFWLRNRQCHDWQARAEAAPKGVEGIAADLEAAGDACALQLTERGSALFGRDSKTSGGKGGKGGNLQSFGNNGLFDDGATWRKPAETGGNRRKLPTETLLEKLSAALLSQPKGTRQRQGPGVHPKSETDKTRTVSQERN